MCVCVYFEKIAKKNIVKASADLLDVLCFRQLAGAVPSATPEVCRCEKNVYSKSNVLR